MQTTQQPPKVSLAQISVFLLLTQLHGFVEMISAFAKTFPGVKFMHKIPGICCDQNVEVTVEISTSDASAGEIATCLQIFLQTQDRVQSLDLVISSIQYLDGTDVQYLDGTEV